MHNNYGTGTGNPFGQSFCEESKPNFSLTDVEIAVVLDLLNKKIIEINNDREDSIKAIEANHKEYILKIESEKPELEKCVRLIDRIYPAFARRPLPSGRG